ncbi:hypothetical protein F441_12890 [Phytophthora nicotianae CJ01A1]|uniref:Uncharacterized protein n=3 Tax=Phytophthora nicotianae TaxID=4792 RepID=W2WM23_PHYNI|nr:hypothetical protein L915_12628 [Phytophthora nicotianae]ETO70493.1 hypothetical protein F444_13028 [Phytophthora nicotianae P1976]ETP11600.1 hypothetical protein F441_12890 [Phytophthora nicotianae CJ01A1]
MSTSRSPAYPRQEKAHIESHKRLCHMAGTTSLCCRTTQSAGRGRHTKPSNAMSGLTPNAFANEPTGLQDVLAFIADFEMEDSHDSDSWMEDELSTSGQGKAQDANLEELFIGGGRRSSPTTASSNKRSMVVPSNATAASMMPRRHRVSRKEELEYLRKKVAEMEDKLNKLKKQAEGGGTPPPPAPVVPEDAQAAMQLEQSVALWKKMAQRQKSQREMVESENGKLREKLKTQVRMAKSLQRILRKRERAAEEITAESPKRFKQLCETATDLTDAGSTLEFDALTQNLDALYAITNERIALCPVASGANPVLRKQDVKYNDFTGMFLEFLHSKLVPFDLASVNRASWRHMSEPGIKYNSYFEESATATENTVMRKFGVEIKQDTRTAKMAGIQAIRRYVESDRIVIVRESVIDQTELGDAAAQGITFRDVGWLVLKDVTGQVSASGPMTLVQSYSTLTPDLDLNSRWEVGALTDFVLQSREDMEVGNESIVENLLLEEAAKRTTP